MNQICVFGATERELRSAEEHLNNVGPLSSGIRAAAGENSPPCTLHLHSLPSSTSTNPDICGTFDQTRYFSTLDTTSLGRTLFTAATTASTQSVIQDNIAKLPNGVLFVADRQVGGKGRGGNVWESPPGCLMFSTSYRLAISGQRLPFVQYLVTLAVVQAAQAEAYNLIKQSLSQSNASLQLSRAPLDIKIKWPNDVYAGGLKLGGILCHSSYRDNMFHVIMGVGLNVANSQPTTCINDLVAAAAQAAGATVIMPNAAISRESLLAGIMTRLEPMLTKLSEEGFRPFEAEYYAAWLHSSQRVQIVEESENGSVKYVDVIVKGLSPHGYLMAEDAENGGMYELHPDGNSFDFFKGLVRKKLPPTTDA